jgi:uncharacterized LabA/DUF88 family protein
LAHQERVNNLAVFIDFDNIEIGVKTTLNEHFDIGTILEALKERGEVVTKIAYADWTRAGEYSRNLTQHAIRLVQRNLTPGGDKNGADINLALDALEMAFTHPHINAYVIVGGDSDFLSLVEKLKQYDKKVFVVGGRAFTSVILQRNCHEFIAYENLTRRTVHPRPGGRPQPASNASSPIAQAFPIVRRALKVLADREVSPQTGLLKSTLLQLDSTFSERSYGASSFLDFTEKLAQAGLVQLKHSGRSVMVELNPDFKEDAASETPKPSSDGGVVAGETSSESPRTESAPAQPQTTEQPSRLGDNADGVRIAGQLLGAATNARWPMYLRNAKQILRAGSFDERRYGFGGLIELLKACQRDGLVRIERDRRGGLRVFQGQALARPQGQPSGPSAPPAPVLPQPDVEDEIIDEPQPFRAEPYRADVGETESEPDIVSVVDTTAEMLGRATQRKPRARARAVGQEAAEPKTRPRKTAAKKPASAPRRGSRKKSGSDSE